MKANIIFLSAVASVALAAAQASVFEIHAVEPKASAKTKSFTIDNAGRIETVHLSNDTLIDRAALFGARATEETATVTSGAKPEQKTVPALKLTFTNDGLTKFTEVTTALLGKQVGVLIDGKLVATPAIREPMKRNTITLTGKFTKEEATAMAEKIKTGK